MSKLKITSEPEGRVVPMARQEMNPYDGIVATLDGETMGRPHVKASAPASNLPRKPRKRAA